MELYNGPGQRVSGSEAKNYHDQVGYMLIQVEGNHVGYKQQEPISHYQAVILSNIQVES